MLTRLVRWWKMRGHVHDWRPAEAVGKPARVCDECRAWEQISEAEFYALFGKFFKALRRGVVFWVDGR